MRPHAARLLLVVVVLVAVSALTLAAQPWFMTDAPGTWKPWKMTLSSGARASTRATPAELKAFEAHLVAFRELLRRTPAVAEPKGYSVEVWGHLRGDDRPASGQAPAGRRPIGGGVDFGAFPIYEYMRNGTRVRTDTGETALLLFAVNTLDARVIGQPGPPEWNPLDLDIVVQPPATGERAGFPLFDDIVVITKRDASIWAPVALLEAWQVQLQASTRALAEARQVAEKMQQSRAEHVDPVRKAKREAEYRKNAASMPNAEEYLKQMAEVEAIRDRVTRDEIAPTSGTMVRLREAEREVAAVEVVIAALPGEERTMPACWLPDATRVQGRFRAGPNARCRALVRPNAAFFDPALPRSAPQLLLITSATRCYEDRRDTGSSTTSPSGCTANRALLESWDRQAVLDWLQ
ncbi:hypothetical protein [Luteitalea sp.]|uniref:hypothetical protein n=1 Tax=Luteitalea sp. TaxID=2004800 RepID=UPI0025BE460C|nr:hypothetical protein [Luteitalea sp.]